MYIDSVACRWQWQRMTAEKIIKYTKCKMQMPHDIHENGQKRKKNLYENVYPWHKMRDASEPCIALLPSCTSYFYPLFFFINNRRAHACVYARVGLRVYLITGI